MLIPNPTWSNHESVVLRSGLNYVYYPYYDPVTKRVKIDSLLEFLQNSQEGSIVLLHACAHNPTGVDPTSDDWQKIADVMQKKKLVPFFDAAYQGFASGDLTKDVAAIRLFADKGFDMLVAQSFAKNMGLYGERVGAIHLVTPNR